jgi:hypothetical protein
MKGHARLASIGVALLALGCAVDEANTPTAARVPASASGNAADRLMVMTQNMYVGADVDAILVAILTGGDLAAVLTEQVQVLQNTEFARRAGALADVIARDRPHLVGLQEISTIDIDIPAAGLDYQMDFLPVLMNQLAARGLPYVIAGQVTNFTVSPTLPVPGTVSLTDQDILLVDASRGNVAGPVTAKTFVWNLGTVAPGVTIKRGFVMVPVQIHGTPYLVTTTHLESDLAGNNLTDLRYAQMSEIVGYADAYSMPRTVIMGDLNDFEGSLMYDVATDAEFADLWRTLRPGTTGFTCCNYSDLSNPRHDHNQRIDFIFVRGFDGPPGRVMGQIDRVNFNPGDKVPGPSYKIWMSDHAGLVGTLLMPR